MGQQNLNFGTPAPNDGETVLSAFTKIQVNFTELYSGNGSFGFTDVASAATTDIGAAPTPVVRITGTNPIISLGTVPNTRKWVVFADALILTHNATSLILPGGVDITTAAGHTMLVVSDASGNWRCWEYQPAPTGGIANDAVTDAKLRNSAALSVIGRSASSVGDPADIVGADGQVLRVAGTALGFGTVATAGIANDAVTDAKLRDSAGLSVIGRAANSSGDPADIVGTDGQVLRVAGTVLGFGTIATAGIANDAVTDPKLRNSGALSVIGRSANSAGDPADISASPASGAVLRESGETLGFGQIATAGIVDNAVTYAKLQDISAQFRALGRNSSGAGDPEEVTLSQLLDWIGSAAQGDILYRGASAWARLPAGTSGNVLQTQGPGANPQWAVSGGAGDFVLLTSGTVASAASLDIVLTGFTAYRALKFVLSGFVPATDDVELWMRFSTDGGSSYDAGASDYSWGLGGWQDTGVAGDYADASDSEIVVAGRVVAGGSVSNVAAEGGADAELMLHGRTDAARWSRVRISNAYVIANGPSNSQHGFGLRLAAQDTDAVRFLFESGNIASGKYAVYGLA